MLPKSDKDEFEVDFEAVVVGYPVSKYAQTKAIINFTSSFGIITIRDLPPKLRSVHHITVNDATVIGYDAQYHLEMEEITWILALSFSLSNPNVLFTTVGSIDHPASLNLKEKIVEEFGKMTHQISKTLGYSVSVDINIALEERKILETAQYLLKFQIFNNQGRNRKEFNTIKAIHAYINACQSSDIKSCFRSLYTALEIGVTAENTTLKDHLFDAEASRLSGVKSDKIKEWREFYNRLKHADRQRQDSKVYIAGQNKIKEFMKELKPTVDSVILFRIS